RRRRRFGRGRIWLCLRRKGEAARPEKGDNDDDTAHSELDDPTPFVQEAGDTRNIPATYQSNGEAKAGVATATELALAQTVSPRRCYCAFCMNCTRSFFIFVCSLRS